MDRRGGYEEPTTNERRRRDVASPRRQKLLGVQEPRHAKHFDYAGPRSIGLV
ncbi:unnamed protein product, partial [Ascophyllum nodosum]